VKLLEHVEHNVRLELLNRIADWKELIQNAECADFVSELAETLDDVDLGLEGERLLRREPVE
jgi:hypothetical protein